jgi:AcrR family transcriptional regulator
MTAKRATSVRTAKRPGSVDPRGEREATDPRRTSATPRVPRPRRTPEEARAHLLAAAERVFAARGPDAAGLKDVAREAAVSHALVTHYFGTYEGLVDAVFERYVARTRTRLLERLAGVEADALGDVERVVRELFDALADPTYARLASWALVSGRVDDRDFFPRRRRGLKLVADAIEAAGPRLRPPLRLPREAVESLVVLVLSSILGYLTGAGLFWESLGSERSPERDRVFLAQLARAVRTIAFERAARA